MTTVTYNDKQLPISLDRTNGFSVSPDGQFLLVLGNGRVTEKPLSTAFDITTAGADSGEYFFQASRFSVRHSSDGNLLYVATGDNPEDIEQYDKSGGVDNLVFLGEATLPEGSGFEEISSDGKYLYAINGSTIERYEMSTPGDITSLDTSSPLIADLSSYLAQGLEAFALSEQGDSLFVVDSDDRNRFLVLDVDIPFDVTGTSEDTVTDELVDTTNIMQIVQLRDGDTKAYSRSFRDFDDYVIRQYAVEGAGGPSIPSAFWTEHVGTREIRRA